MDPSGLAAIHFEFNAFISPTHDLDGDGWIPEPYLFWPGPYYANTNGRMAGQPGGSKISVWIDIDSCAVGKDVHTHGSSIGASVRGKMVNGSIIQWAVGTSPLRASAGVWKTPPCTSNWSGNFEGAYYFAPLFISPTINMGGEVRFTAGADTVTVTYDLWHDWFPDYEVIIEGGGQRFVDPDYAPPQFTPVALFYKANKTQSGSITLSVPTRKCCGGTCAN
jgi:hypothetical protein